MLGLFLKSLLGRTAALFNRRDALIAKGVAAFGALDFGAAQKYLERADKLRPLDGEELYMLGAALLHCGRLDQAEEVLHLALEADPDNADAQKILATKYLLEGDWREGFSRYEACRHEIMRRNADQKLNREWLRCIEGSLADIPVWRGESLAGKRILVWSEQGHGDAIMTLRLLSELGDRHGAHEVAFLSMAAEKCLFEAAGGQRFFEARWGWRPATGEFDYHCSIISLLYLLDVRPDHVPGCVPYLRIPEEKLSVWHQRLAKAGGFKVGLAWAGNMGLSFDALRSLPVTRLEPLFALNGVGYFSLQKDAASRAALHAHAYPITDLMDLCGDFIDTAALIANLDLVISVDTAVAHLAGAMGKPVWLLNRFESEWRWMRGREDSVWYPGMRIFNQAQPRNWAPVIDRVADELAKLLADGRPDTWQRERN